MFTCVQKGSSYSHTEQKLDWNKGDENRLQGVKMKHWYSHTRLRGVIPGNHCENLKSQRRDEASNKH
jgi:hypothetical protein